MSIWGKNLQKCLKFLHGAAVCFWKLLCKKWERIQKQWFITFCSGFLTKFCSSYLCIQQLISLSTLRSIGSGGFQELQFSRWFLRFYPLSEILDILQNLKFHLLNFSPNLTQQCCVPSARSFEPKDQSIAPFATNVLKDLTTIVRGSTIVSGWGITGSSYSSFCLQKSRWYSSSQCSHST